MNVNIINQSSYKSIKVAFNGTEITLEKNEFISNIDISGDTKVEIYVLEKNRVLLNLLFALIDGFVDGESVINSLVCNVSFIIKSLGTEQTVVVKDLEYRDDKNGYIYESVYVENDSIEDISYNLTSVDKARRKSLFYYIFVVSWVPFLLALLGYYFLFRGNVLALIAGLLIFLVFTIPSWKKVSRVKKYYSNEFSNEVLISEIIKIKNNNDISKEPTDVIGKATHKVLDLLFKRKK